MPAAAIIAPIAIDAATTSLATTLLGTIAASTFGVVGGAIVTGAVGGAVGGAIGSAVTGGDPGMSALTGAISSGVGGGVGAISSGVSPIEKAAINAATSFGTGTAGSLISGQNLGNALKSGAVSGIGSGIASGIGSALSGSSEPSGTQAPIPSLEPDTSSTPMGNRSDVFPGEQPFLGQQNVLDNSNSSFNVPQGTNQKIQNALSGASQSALSYGIQSGLTNLFGSNTPTSTSSGLALPSFNQPSVTTPNASNTVTPGSGPSINALTQALTTVGDLGYSPGGPVFGSQSNEPKRKVWNQASLRVTDDQDNQ